MNKISKIIETLYKDPVKAMLALKLLLLATIFLVKPLKGDPIEIDGW